MARLLEQEEQNDKQGARAKPFHAASSTKLECTHGCMRSGKAQARTSTTRPGSSSSSLLGGDVALPWLDLCPEV